MNEFFKRGDVVLVHYHHPLLGTERGSPARVCEDNARRTVLFISSGSEYKKAVWLGAAPPAPDQIGKFEKGVWSNYSMLRIMYPDVPYSIWPMWRANDGEFVRWYVNIESPFERQSYGFDVVDYELDIVVGRDLSWEWKDEDELQRLVDVGIFTSDEASEFRKFGLDAIRRLERQAEPFNEPWPEWRPDPGWGPLRMPEDDLWMIGGTEAINER